jgi:hypothetical protein
MICKLTGGELTGSLICVDPSGAQGKRLDSLGGELGGILGDLNVHAGLANRVGKGMGDACLSDEVDIGHATRDVDNLLLSSLLNEGKKSICRPEATVDGSVERKIEKLLCGINVKGDLSRRIRNGLHIIGVGVMDEHIKLAAAEFRDARCSLEDRGRIRDVALDEVDVAGLGEGLELGKLGITDDGEDGV